MPRGRKKTIVPINQTEEVAPVEAIPEVAVEESEAKKQFRAFIEVYRQKNPVKYARKEPELLKKLNSL